MNRELAHMCLIYVAHEHYKTKTGKKSKPALKFYGAEDREKLYPVMSS